MPVPGLRRPHPDRSRWPARRHMCARHYRRRRPWARPSTSREDAEPALSRRSAGRARGAGRRSRAFFRFRGRCLGRSDARFLAVGIEAPPCAARSARIGSPPNALNEKDISDICASFQAAVMESTADRLSVGLRFQGAVRRAHRAGRAGGVAANQAIRLSASRRWPRRPGRR